MTGFKDKFLLQIISFGFPCGLVVERERGTEKERDLSSQNMVVYFITSFDKTKFLPYAEQVSFSYN